MEVAAIHRHCALVSSKSSSSGQCRRPPVCTSSVLISRPCVPAASLRPSTLVQNPLSFNPILHTTAAGRRTRRRRRRRGGRSTIGVGARPCVFAVFERFTERAIKGVILSQKEARALGKDMVFTQHLLLGLIAEDSSPDGFLGSGISIDDARDAVRRKDGVDESTTPANGQHPLHGPATDVPFSVSSKRVFEAAVDYSRTMGCNFIAPEHIAIGLLTVGTIGLLIKSLGADANHLASVALSRLQGELAKDAREIAAAPTTSPKIREKLYAAGKPLAKQTSHKKNDKSCLAQFCVDLTARAIDERIDPVVGRNTEVQRVVQILCRRTKNNPILLGEPGVGKTAIAEGLAIRIVHGEIPSFLSEKRIMSLDIGLLMAGAKERGELESRVIGLISEVKKAGNIIVFVDEVHTLIGSGTVGRGNKGSGLDIANLLKPALGRGELQCIASTTLDEHRKHFEKDKALARRFQPVLINEPSQEDTLQILLGLREKYEAHHKCRFTLEALHAAVYLSSRYIPDRHLPDKAIDLIDEAGSRGCIYAYKRKKEQHISVLSRSPDEYWKEIRAVQTMHEQKAVDNARGEGPAIIGSEVGVVLEPSYSIDDELVIVGPEDIAAVASLWSGVPVQQLTADETKLLIELDNQLKDRVIGQDDAVSAIARAVKRSRVGLKDPDRPIAAMLFCGPTGVGKTELTKALAACYFGSETAMLRLDMSEYMERHTVSKLIGSPPGYVGYGDGGTLTEAVRSRPFSVVLLDEIEKAHPDIFNILLQVFEDGHLTDSQGRRVSFKNTLIIMTSNVGSATISKGRQSIGFMLSDDNESNSYTAMKAHVMEELKAYFRPEFLNRLDEMVVFRALEKMQMLEILNIMLEEVKDRLMTKGIQLEVSEAVMNLVCEQGFDKSYGARPLRRAMTSIIEDVVSEALLADEYKEGDNVVLDVNASGKSFVAHNNIHLSG